MSIVTAGVTAPIANQHNSQYYAPITLIEFSNVAQGTLPPAGAQGTLVLKNVPPFANYVMGQGIVYQDGNNNNTVSMTVTSVVGPTKYKIVAV